MPEEANQQNHYPVVIVKRTAGCTENQGSWPQVNWQHIYLVSEVEILNVQSLDQDGFLLIHHRAN